MILNSIELKAKLYQSQIISENWKKCLNIVFSFDDLLEAQKAEPVTQATRMRTENTSVHDLVFNPKMYDLAKKFWEQKKQQQTPELSKHVVRTKMP